MSHASFRKAALFRPGLLSPAGVKGRVLVVDDDPLFAEMLAELVKEMGHEADTAATLAEGWAKAAGAAYDLVLVDVRLPDGSGLELLGRLGRLPRAPEVLLITGAGDPDGAGLARQSGAWGYLARHASLRETRLALTRALASRTERERGPRLLALELEGIVGRSPEMWACYHDLARAAAGEAPVLFLGEPGTGKELFARALHANSSRSRGPFVAVSAPALAGSPEAAGMEGNSWPELCRRAREGSLFLAEVDALSLPGQLALLAILDRPPFATPEGSFRLLAASHRDLARLTQEGAFSPQLWERLQGFILHLPPLRKRREDIPELALFHLMSLSRQPGREMKGFAPDFLEALLAYEWPGNVAELVAVLHEAVDRAGAEPVLRAAHLPPPLRVGEEPLREEVPQPAAPPAPGGTLKEYRRRVLAQAEKAYLEELLARVQNNLREACRLSALSLPRLYALLKKYRIKV